MRGIQRVLPVVAVVALSSCARTLLVGNGKVPHQLDPAVGYVAAVFTTGFDTQWAFDLSDARGVKHEIAFGREDVAMRRELRVYPLPPGRYRVARWKGFNAGWGRPDADEKIPETDVLARPFELKAGQVVFLGMFDASRDRTPSEGWNPFLRNKAYFQIHSIAITSSDAVAAVRAAAPALAADVRCILCAPESL